MPAEDSFQLSNPNETSRIDAISTREKRLMPIAEDESERDYFYEQDRRRSTARFAAIQFRTGSQRKKLFENSLTRDNSMSPDNSELNGRL